MVTDAQNNEMDERLKEILEKPTMNIDQLLSTIGELEMVNRYYKNVITTLYNELKRLSSLVSSSNSTGDSTTVATDTNSTSDDTSNNE